MQAEAEQVFVHDVLYEYAAKLVRATRVHPMAELGVGRPGADAYDESVGVSEREKLRDAERYGAGVCGCGSAQDPPQCQSAGRDM